MKLLKKISGLLLGATLLIGVGFTSIASESKSANAQQPFNGLTYKTSIGDLATANNWKSGDKIPASVKLNSNLIMTWSGGSNNVKYFSSGPDIRVYTYGNGSITFTLDSKSKYEDITLTFNCSNATATYDGTVLSTNTAFVPKNNTVTIKPVKTDTKNGNIQIKNICIRYKPTVAKLIKEIKQDADSKLVKTSYRAGEAFDPTGLKLTIYYGDNTNEPVRLNQVNWNPLVTGDTSATGKYLGHTFTIPGITVIDDVLESVLLSGNMIKKVYADGQSFNPDGLIVTETYASGKTVVIDDKPNLKYTPAKPTLGTKSVKIEPISSNPAAQINFIDTPITVNEANLVFSNGLTNDSVQISAANPLWKMRGFEYVSSDTVYNGAYDELKLGKSKTAGSITLRLIDANSYISSVTVNCSSNRDKSLYSVNGIKVKSFTPYKDEIFDVSADKTDTLTIASLSSTVYVNYINVVTEARPSVTVTGVSVTGASEITSGYKGLASTTLTATVSYTGISGTNLVDWKVMDGPATIDENGKVTFNDNGVVKVVATSKEDASKCSTPFTINVSNLKDAEVYSKVTSIADLTEGAKVAVLAKTIDKTTQKSSYFAMTRSLGKYFSYKNVEASDTTYAHLDTEVTILTVNFVSGSTTNFTLSYMDGATTKYLCTDTDKNELYNNGNPTNNAAQWTLDAKLLIKNIALNARNIAYNSNSGQERFSTYKGTQNPASLYVLSTVPNISIAADTPHIGLGKTGKLTINTSDVPSNVTPTYELSNGNISLDEKGIYTGQNLGTVTITAKVVVNGVTYTSNVVTIEVYKYYYSLSEIQKIDLQNNETTDVEYSAVAKVKTIEGNTVTITDGTTDMVAYQPVKEREDLKNIVVGDELYFHGLVTRRDNKNISQSPMYDLISGNLEEFLRYSTLTDTCTDYEYGPILRDYYNGLCSYEKVVLDNTTIDDIDINGEVKTYTLLEKMAEMERLANAPVKINQNAIFNDDNGSLFPLGISLIAIANLGLLLTVSIKKRKED